MTMINCKLNVHILYASHSNERPFSLLLFKLLLRNAYTIQISYDNKEFSLRAPSFPVL